MTSSADSADRQTDALKTVLALHAIALDGMAEGLCVLDSEFRIVLLNRRFLEIFGLPRGSVRPGAPLKDVIEQTADQSPASNISHADMWRSIEQMFTQRQSFDLNQRTASGVLVRFRFQPTSGNGWVATCAPAAQPSARDQDSPSSRWHQAFVNSSRGVCVYDTNKRLALYNDQFLQLYGLDSDHIKPGMSCREIL